VKLTELDPRWFTIAHPADGVDFRIGLTFLCPHCRTQRLGVQFDPPIDPGNLIGRFGILWPKAHHVWQRTGDTFETLTLTPSIDASGDGHWHGWITDGQIR
jgi:hypothetical protein